jgi:hypothetical protein
MSPPKIIAPLFLASGLSYWLLEIAYRHLLAISPSFAPLVTKFPPEAMYFALLVWFLIIASPICLGAFAIAFALRRGAGAVPMSVALLIAAAPALLFEFWNQFTLQDLDDLWRLSILNTLRFAFFCEFIIAFGAGLAMGTRPSADAPVSL